MIGVLDECLVMPLQVEYQSKIGSKIASIALIPNPIEREENERSTMHDLKKKYCDRMHGKGLMS